MAILEERRYEIKCSFHIMRLPAIRAAITTQSEGFRVDYPARQVNNAYLDTPDLAHYNANRDGFSDRDKVRVRWYGESDSAVAAALEVKRRRGGTNSKLRHHLARDLDLVGGPDWSNVLSGIREGLPVAMLAAVGFAWRPVLITRYFREYYATPDGRVRATLDHGQVTYSQLASYRPNVTFPLPPLHTAVLEVKAPLSEEKRVMEITSSMPVRVSRNSKYAIALERALHV